MSAAHGGQAPGRAAPRGRGLSARPAAVAWRGPLAGWLLALCLAVPCAAWAAATQPGLEMLVRLDPTTRVLRGEAVLTTSEEGALELALGEGYRVQVVRAQGVEDLGPGRAEGGERVWTLPGRPGGQRVEVEWSGTLEALDTGLTHRETLGATAAVAGPEGAFLPAAALWHPRLRGRAMGYRVEVSLPAGWVAVAPGRPLAEQADAQGWRGGFEFAHPSEGVDLMAGPYLTQRRELARSEGEGSIELRTYFHPELGPLAADYLESVAGYLTRYERLLGAYPFESFSVVSSPTPTGFGMPGLTYLGVEVLKLPFIRHTSLGHEVLHCWLGNGVYPDYARGNWSEGLTTFLADYAYKEDAGPQAAREARLAWLRDFAAVPPGQDRPLAEFTSRTHGTSQIVGYGKSAMLFYMLRERIGVQAFERGLREFWAAHRLRVAGWEALRAAFEQASGEDLRAFFTQWLERPGAPALSLVRAEVEQVREDRWRLRVELSQAAPAWTVVVPLRVSTEEGEQTHLVAFDGEGVAAEIPLTARPEAVALDPDLQLFRRLGAQEAPPILREVMVDPATTLVSAGAEAAGEALAARLLDHPPARAPVGQAPPGGPLLVIGLDPEVQAWLERHGLPAPPPEVAGRGQARVWTLARSGAGPVVVVSAPDEQALASTARALPHYGRYSWLVFEGGRASDKGTWPSRPQDLSLR